MAWMENVMHGLCTVCILTIFTNFLANKNFTFNVGIICHAYNAQAIFSLQPRTLQPCDRQLLQQQLELCSNVWVLGSVVPNLQKKVPCVEWFTETKSDTQVQRRSGTTMKIIDMYYMKHCRDIYVCCMRKVQGVQWSLTKMWKAYARPLSAVP